MFVQNLSEFEFFDLKKKTQIQKMLWWKKINWQSDPLSKKYFKFWPLNKNSIEKPTPSEKSCFKAGFSSSKQMFISVGDVETHLSYWPKVHETVCFVISNHVCNRK